MLLQHGADVNERTDEGATALMLACCAPEMPEREEIVKMLIDSGADVNAHSPAYSYFDPYLAPLAEYFKNVGNTEQFSIVYLLVQNGAKVHFCSAELENRKRDPFSILPFCHCIVGFPEVFFLMMEVASKFQPLAIYVSSKIPEGMKDELLLTGTQARGLKHICRLTIHNRLGAGLPDKVPLLPLPAILKSYLLYK